MDISVHALPSGTSFYGTSLNISLDMDLPTLPLHGWISSFNNISYQFYQHIEFNMFIGQILDIWRTL